MNKILLFLLILKVNSYYNKFKKECKANNDCFTFSQSYICEENFCKHEKIEFINRKYFLGYIILLLINIFSSIAGLGGGALIVSSLLLFFNFSIDHAIPISKIIIFFSATLNSIFIIRMNIKNNNIIDYNVLIYSIPFLLIGTIIGIILNNFLPDIFISALLLILMIFLTYMIHKKIKKKANNNEIIEYNQNVNILETNVDQKVCFISNFFCLLVLLIFTYLENVYYIFYKYLISLKFIILFMIALFSCFYKKRKTNSFSSIDKKIIITNLLAGISSGTLGLVGSSILSPILLNLNFTPLITTGITSYTIIFSNTSTSFQFLFLGAIDFNLIITIIIFTLAGSLIGRIIVKLYEKRIKGKNFILYFIYFLFIISTLIIFYNLIILALKYKK